tara:strand:+ start:173 stop:934 length:762 start_codon:yes stop_codon:yes gene_type:complete
MLSKFWSDLTLDEIKKIGKNKVLIFPFSSIEQHGSHLPSGTDRMILDGILSLLVEQNSKSNNFLIMPNLSMGSAGEHLNFEGTISAYSTKYIDYVISIIENLCEKKYKKFLFLNSHGGQIGHLDIIAKELKSKFKFIDIVKAHYFLFDGYEKIISKKELVFGYHGGEFETSIMMFLYPNLVKYKKISSNLISPDYKSNNIISYEKKIKRAWNTQDISKSGIIGDPTKANKEKGKKILKIAVNNILKIINEMTK